MSKIIKVPSSRWHTLEKIFEEEFNSDLPSADNAAIYGDYEGGKLQAFILVENIKMVGQIYSMPDNKNRQSVQKLVNYLVETLPDGTAVGVVASEKRFEALYRLLKMQKIPGTFFRRNL